MSRKSYKRVLLKLSGEALGGDKGPFEEERLYFLAREIALATREKIELGIVIGGGNLLRGASLKELGIDPVASDHVGMLGTFINAILLSRFLQKEGINSRALSSIGIPGVIGQYDARLSRELLEGGEVLVLAGGTGNPFFTTDTAAVLRAKELGADAVFKATKVDYVYDRDPLKDGSAKAFRTLTFKEVINRGLMVMDLTAITLAMELRLPICVFNFSRPGNLIKAANGEEIGTFIWEV